MKHKQVVVIVLMLVFTASPLSSAINTNEYIMPTEEKTSPTTVYDDQLDQNQSVYIEGAFVPIGRLVIESTIVTVQVAQSFIPTKPLLTRIEIFAVKNVTASNPLIVGVRDNLTHENLIETSLPPSSFLSDNFSWVECNFDDIWVTPGKTYYIVTKTKNITDNWYAWAANNNSDAYPNGCAWFSIDNGSSWNQSATLHQHQQNKIQIQRPVPFNTGDASGDMCFRTYGLREATLDITPGGTFFSPALLLTNNGNITALGVTWQMVITGGILKLINKTSSGNQSELVSDDSMSLPISVFGLGPIVVSVEAKAVNVQKAMITQHAVVLLIFVLWE